MAGPSKVTPVNQFIWAALVTSNLMYGLILAVTKPDGWNQPFPSQHPLLVPFMVISSMALAISMVLPKGLWMSAKRKLDAGPQPVTERQVRAAFFAPWVIRMAMLESISLYGLSLAFTSGSNIAWVPFGAVSILTQLSQFPSMPRMREMLGLKSA